MGGRVVGDVVQVWFPFTDMTGGKRRPAVVLAYVGMNDWILCELTSSNQSRPGDVPVRRSDMQSGTLNSDSSARVGRVHTLNEKLFRRIYGRLTDVKLAEIHTAVRGLF